MGSGDSTCSRSGRVPGTAIVKLLEAGARDAVAYDISPSYEDIAGALLAGRGLRERVEWHTGDYLASGDDRRADIVFLNRVVCCYPDLPPLIDTVASRAQRWLALSYPRRRWFTRAGVRMLNGYFRLRRVPFRVFVHDPETIESSIAAAGFEEVAAGGSATWEWKVWRRAA